MIEIFLGLLMVVFFLLLVDWQCCEFVTRHDHGAPGRPTWHDLTVLRWGRLLKRKT